MGMLAVGGGAADGLRNYLVQKLREKQLLDEEKRTMESGRHNLAEEGIQNRTIDENAKLRTATAAATEAERLRVERNRGRDDQRAALDDVMPGARISTETRDAAVKNGAALPERFKPVTFYDEDFVGPIQPNGPQRGDVGAYTLGDNPNRAAAGPVTLETKTVSYHGKPVDATWNPKTDVYTYKGVDITNDRDHWDKPPAPDRVLVQTGDGYRTRDDVRSDLKGGKEVPLATPAATRTRQDLAERVSSHFDDIQQELDDANRKGVLGPLEGRTYVDFLAGKVGSTGDAETDQLLGDLRMNLSLVRSGLGQLHGRGGANVGIVQGLEKKMDEGHMSYAELTGALKAMKGWVDTYATRKGSGQATAAPAADDLYTQYLNRPKP